MDALEHYKKAEELLAGAHDSEGRHCEPTDSQVSRATAHLLASVAATLATQPIDFRSGALYVGENPNNWAAHLYPWPGED